MLNLIKNENDMNNKTMVEKMDESVDIVIKANELVDNVLENKIVKSAINSLIKEKLVDENEDKFNGNINKILYHLKEMYNVNINKKSNKIKYAIAIPAIALFPCCSVIGYVGYKGLNVINKINKNKKENEILRRNFKIFLNIYESIGLCDRMEDMFYEPNREELELLFNQYKIRTDGGNLIELLSVVYH